MAVDRQEDLLGVVAWRPFRRPKDPVVVTHDAAQNGPI